MFDENNQNELFHVYYKHWISVYKEGAIRKVDLSQVFRQIFVESVFLFSKMIFQTHLGFGNQLSYECDFDCTNLQCI